MMLEKIFDSESEGSGPLIYIIGGVALLFLISFLTIIAGIGVVGVSSPFPLWAGKVFFVIGGVIAYYWGRFYSLLGYSLPIIFFFVIDAPTFA